MIKDSDDFEFNLNETGVDETKFLTKRSRSKSGDNWIGEQRNSERDEEMVYVGISDTGKGISSKIMPKLFEKFTTDSEFGTGLGLFITKKLVEAHGGRIWAFNNNDGIGSTFVFSLPR
jgi:signal transduction histidine kinase